MCTLLSAPAFALFWSGNNFNNPNNDLDIGFGTYLASFSLGNIGEKSYNIN